MPCRKTENPKTQTFRSSTSERLSTPKTPHPANIPNRPSVYWLDYLESNEALSLRSPAELSNYYSRFYANLPRLDNLSRPRTSLCDSSGGYTRTANGIPISALNYCATPRIRELAQPRKYDESSQFRLPPIRQSSSSSEEQNIKKAWNNPRQIKTAGGSKREKYDNSNYSPYKTGYNQGRSTEMEGGDAPSNRLMQYSRIPTNQRAQQQPSQSQSNILGNNKQGVVPTGSDSGLKRKPRSNNRTTKLPPLTTSKNGGSNENSHGDSTQIPNFPKSS